MNPRRFKCKDNNAAPVKRMMPNELGKIRPRRLEFGQFHLTGMRPGSQKELDTIFGKSIIIFTLRLGHIPPTDGRPGPQTPDASTTGNAEPAPESRTRRVVSPGRFLRRSRSGPGQVRDAAPGTDRRQVCDRCGRELWLFPAIFLSGTIGLRAKRSCRSGAPQTRPQAGAQTYRRDPHIHWRDASERTIYSIAGSGETDPGTLRHQGSSTKYRAQSAASSKKTLNEAGDPAATRHDLAARYEQLRRDAMGRLTSGDQGLGLALFLRRGMTAWMQAWSECAGNVEPATRSQPVVHETIPVDMRSQIATLLAGMILALQQEAIP